MGASIGVAQLHGPEVAKQIAAKYEEYKAAGVPEEEMQSKLTADYENLCIKLQSGNKAAEDVTKPKKQSGDTAPQSVRRSSKEALARRPSKDLSTSKRGSRDTEPGAENSVKRLSKDTSAPEVGLGLNKRLGERGSAKATGKRSNTRRRSFDNQSVIKAIPQPPAESASTNTSPIKAGIATAGAEEAGSSQKATVAPSPGSPVKGASVANTVEMPAPDPAAMDSWDSVTQQPFCPICHMTFKSVAFYERHVKYSDLHQKAVKKLEDANNKDKANDGGEAAPPPTSPSVKRIEGIHYKLLYTGSKLFWRTQQNIDFDIFLHPSADTIEIIAHDSLASKDVNRLYLSFTGVNNIIKELQKLQPSFGLVSASDEKDEEKDTRTQEEKERNAISRYILQRLQMNPDTKEVSFNSLTSDSQMESPSLPAAPAGLKPVAVVRRRRTNGEEFEAEMNNLHMEQAALEASVEAANHD